LQAELGEEKTARQIMGRAVDSVLNLHEDAQQAQRLCFFAGTQVIIKDVAGARKTLKFAEEASERDPKHILMNTMMSTYVSRLVAVGREGEAMTVILNSISGDENKKTANTSKEQSDMATNIRDALDVLGARYGRRGETDIAEDLLKKLNIPRQRIALLLGLASGAIERERIVKSQKGTESRSAKAPG